MPRTGGKSLRRAVAAIVCGKHQRAYDIYRKMVAELARGYLAPGARRTGT